MATEYKVIPMNQRPGGPESWEQALNEAGSDGWELVSVPATPDIVAAVMKRPKPSEDR